MFFQDSSRRLHDCNIDNIIGKVDGLNIVYENTLQDQRRREQVANTRRAADENAKQPRNRGTVLTNAPSPNIRNPAQQAHSSATQLPKIFDKLGGPSEPSNLTRSTSHASGMKDSHFAFQSQTRRSELPQLAIGQDGAAHAFFMQSGKALSTRSPSIAELSARLPVLKLGLNQSQGDIEVIVRALMMAMNEMAATRPVHRFETLNKKFQRQTPTVPEDRQRQNILRVLERYTLCDVGELLTCDPSTWSAISQALGGVSHTIAVRCAHRLLGTGMVKSIERASYHAASNHRQRTIDRGRGLL